jgi:hypothetical protein
MEKPIFFLLITLSFCLSTGVKILSPPEIEKQLLTGPLQILPKIFYVEGELVLVKSSCSFDEVPDEDIPTFNGKILLFEGIHQTSKPFTIVHSGKVPAQIW